MAVQNNELDAIRQRRLQEIQGALEQQATQQVEDEFQQQKLAKAQNELDSLIKSILAPEARERLARISLVDQALSNQAKQYFAHLYHEGHLSGQISDLMLKSYLQQQSKSRSTTSVRRI